MIEVINDDGVRLVLVQMNDTAIRLIIVGETQSASITLTKKQAQELQNYLYELSNRLE